MAKRLEIIRTQKENAYKQMAASWKSKIFLDAFIGIIQIFTAGKINNNGIICYRHVCIIAHFHTSLHGFKKRKTTEQIMFGGFGRGTRT